MNAFILKMKRRKKAMKYFEKNKASSASVIYETPEISVIKMKNDVITNSYDTNEGEWDVEGEE